MIDAKSLFLHRRKSEGSCVRLLYRKYSGVNFLLLWFLRNLLSW